MNAWAAEYLLRRDEILQLLFWMAGEGIGTSATQGQMEALLGMDAEDVGTVLRAMEIDGLVGTDAGGAYHLTDAGRDAGARSFALEFDGWTGQAHGECGPECACHAQGGEAGGCTR